jgi:pyruvate dehydrogenase E2 component (dihydrolipoamide acetyltransferase)
MTVKDMLDNWKLMSLIREFDLYVKEFAKKAKDKKLQHADWEGSTFTISNLGMFGIDQFTAL